MPQPCFHRAVWCRIVFPGQQDQPWSLGAGPSGIWLLYPTNTRPEQRWPLYPSQPEAAFGHAMQTMASKREKGKGMGTLNMDGRQLERLGSSLGPMGTMDVMGRTGVWDGGLDAAMDAAAAGTRQQQYSPQVGRGQLVRSGSLARALSSPKHFQNTPHPSTTPSAVPWQAGGPRQPLANPDRADGPDDAAHGSDDHAEQHPARSHRAYRRQAAADGQPGGARCSKTRMKSGNSFRARNGNASWLTPLCLIPPPCRSSTAPSRRPTGLLSTQCSSTGSRACSTALSACTRPSSGRAASCR